MTIVVDVSTSVGPARWHVDDAPGAPRTLLVLGHGAGGGVRGGVTSPDLALLAAGLPPLGVMVARFEQPWRVAGRPVATAPAQLDRAWTEAMGQLAPASGRRPGLPLVVGGRSAGARVACRTASALGADGVLALAFPLHPPGRPERPRSDELVGDRPLLVVQGTRDAFGSADELVTVLPEATAQVTALTGADHALRVARAAPVTQQESDELLLLAVRRWLAVVRRDAPRGGNQPGRDRR